MNKINIVAILIFFSFVIKGQQLPVLNQFVDNLSIINPAAVSSEYFKSSYELQVGINYRTQWVGIEGAPNTQSIIINKLIDRKKFVGASVGGYIVNDQAGPIGTTGVYGKIGMVFG